MKQKISYFIFIISILIFSSGCATSYNQKQLHVVNKTKELCKNKDKSNKPWHISNLYDCKTQSFFIPYELWSGAEYKGDKANSINHQVNKKTEEMIVRKNGKTRLKEIHIQGTEQWKSSEDEVYEIYKRYRPNTGKMQYFIANEMGIGRVYDSRYGEYNELDLGIKFPAGYGWKLNHKKGMGRTNVQIISFNINDKNELSGIKFKWWTRGHLDHIYTYKRNIGMTKAEKQ